jgi:replicative DNA helicase
MTKAQQFEDALVSFAMKFPAFLEDDVALQLTPSDFANGNGEVWSALKLAHADGGVNVGRIAAQLGKGYDLQYFAALDREYIGTTWAGAQDMARALKAHALRHGLGVIGASLINAAQDAETDVLTAASEAMEKLAAMSMDGAGGTQVVGASLPALDEYIEERAANPGEVWGLPYGLATLDRFTGGAHANQLTMLAGEPGVGKSFLSAQFAMSHARQGPGVVFSLEMGEQEMILRMMRLLGVDIWKVHTGQIGPADRMAIASAKQIIADLPIHIDADASQNVASIRAKLSRLKAKEGISWFVLDYVGLVQEPAKDDNEKTDKVSRQLKLICRGLGLAGLALTSVNKSGMDTSVANKAAMSGSGQQIHHADNVFFLTAIDERIDQVNLVCKKGRGIPNSSNKKMALQKPTGGRPFVELETHRTDPNKEDR